MPVYRYRGIDQKGEEVKGQLRAADQEQLYALLLEKGCHLTWAKKMGEMRRGRPLGAKELARFSRELGTMLHAGILLHRALAILSAEDGLRSDIRRLYEDLLESIGQGFSLSQAMEQQKGVFPPMMIHMFQAAQIAGDMDETALRLADYHSREYKLASKLKSALLYPKLLMVLLAAVTGFLISFVLPQFKGLFELMDQLPLPTRILYGAAELVTGYWHLAAAGAAAAFLAWGPIKRTKPVRAWLDKAKLHVPAFGKLQKTVCTARFARTLSTLYASGVPVELALRTAAKTQGNVYIGAQLEQVTAMVESGLPLSQALETVDGVLKKLSGAVKVGEEAGSLDTMLLSMADSMEYEAELATEQMTADLEPWAIIVMALVVGFVMIAVMMPIYGAYNAVERMGF